jgi:nucleotide-binding universal stress UspA family protein
MFKKILCPVDFSETSLNASNNAIELAEQLKSAITFIHVLDINLMQNAGDLSFGSVDIYETLAEEEKGLLKKLEDIAVSKGVVVNTVLTHGIPQDIVLEKAKSEHYELIVMGTHGRTGLSRVLLGSVAESLVRHSSLPVLLFRKQ